MVKMSTVWDRTAEFLTDNLGTIMPIALLAFFVPFSINGSFQQAAFEATQSLRLVFALMAVAFAILAVWGGLALAALVYGDDSRAAGARGGRRLLPALVVRVSLGAALALFFLPSIIAIAASGISLSAFDVEAAQELTPGARTTVALNVLVALPLLLWLAARLVLIDPVILSEGRMFGAIGRSWRLTRGITLRIVGVILLYIIVSMVAALATKFVFGSVFTLIAGSGGVLSLAGVLTSITVAAVQTILAVVSALFIAHLLLAVSPKTGTAPAA